MCIRDRIGIGVFRLANETRKGVGLARQEHRCCCVWAVVGMVARAEGVEIPVPLAFGPKVDLHFLAFTGGSELQGAIPDVVQREVREERLLG